MKIKILLSLLLPFLITNKYLYQEPFSIKIEPFTITEAPRVQSYSWGKTNDGKWIILGGRTEGLHKMRPFEAFKQNENNKNIILIDPENNKVWSASLSVLPTSIFEQLQATNQEFHQRGNTLYVIGGYGYSDTNQDHMTYDNLTAVDIDGLANAIINKTRITTFFRQISNANLAVTGGQLGQLNTLFYLCGGQYFEGRYNPMGPDHGPGFIQNYTNEIRKFEIIDDGTNLSINNYLAIKDEKNLHRRDYNMVPQIFPDGEQGITMFSGVFQYNDNVPWLNSVDVTTKGYKVNNEFKQYLSHYHSAKFAMFDSKKNEMHTLFFGGMSQFQLNENGKLVQDDNVPFIKSISMVTRSKNGTMSEKDLGVKMPTFLGTGAEFIPVENQNIYFQNDIINFKKLEKGNNLVGYIYGGIESTKENIFFNNTGSQSTASNKVFKVYVNKK